MKTINNRIEELVLYFCNGNNSKFGAITGINEANIRNYIAGTEPKFNVIKKIAENFDINFEWLLIGKGEMLKNTYVIENTTSEVNESLEIYNSNTNKNIMYVPIVTQYAYAGFLQGYADEEYIKELPTYPVVVDKEHKGTYRVFEVRGDSMDDESDRSIKEYSKILCRNIQRHLWERNKIHFKKYLFLIVTTEGIVVKQITAHNVEEGYITVHSFNPYYEDYNINIDEIVLLFNVLEVYSKPKI